MRTQARRKSVRDFALVAALFGLFLSGCTASPDGKSPAGRLAHPSDQPADNYNYTEENVRILRDTLADEQAAGNMLAHRLALLALAALYDDDLEFVHRLAGSRSIEVMAEFEGDSWYGQVPDSTGEGDRKLREWLDQGERELEPPHFFIEGHGGFHNVVFRFPQGYLWVQFDDQARLSKLFAGPTDPRERL